MYSTKSFCNVLAFASNEPGVNSPIGEITTYAQTFTKEMGYFHHSSLDGYDLLNLSSITDGEKKAMPQTNVNQAIELVDHVVRLTLGTSGELYYDEVLLQLKIKAESIKANTVEMGSMVQSEGQWVPQWISWTDTETAEENTHKVWLAIEAFKNQYTDFEIVVVPPFDDLDSFFNPGGIVENRIKAITPTQMMERADSAKAGNPETITRTDPYEYRDPANSLRRFDVYWTVVIYGPAGNDPDVIREKLAEYILSKSQYSRDDWASIFPDIFKRTEFIFAPFWDKYAAESRVFDHGIYASIIDHALPVQWLIEHAVGYAEDHINRVAQVMPFPYRSLQMAVVGHWENRDGKTKISDYYPDFINVDGNGADTSRMSPGTQEWVKIMMGMLATAETMDNATDLPKGTYRIIREGKTFLARSVNRVLLLILAKSNTITAPVVAEPS